MQCGSQFRQRGTNAVWHMRKDRQESKLAKEVRPDPGRGRLQASMSAVVLELKVTGSKASA